MYYFFILFIKFLHSYLDGKKLINNQWYPTDLKQRALVDEYLEWQHLNTRLNCAMYFRTKWLEPILFGKEPKSTTVARFEKGMEEVLNTIENIWLKDQNFIASNSITVADIFAACEIEQPSKYLEI